MQHSWEMFGGGDFLLIVWLNIHPILFYLKTFKHIASLSNKENEPI